jgi:hypothetical protein
VCQSLVVRDTESGKVKFTHYSVQEYLREYPNLPPVSALVKICLTYLSFNEFENGACQTEEELETRLKTYKAGPYVAQFWGFYAKKAEKFCDVQDTVYAFLTSENKRNAMLQMEIFARSWWRKVPFTETGTMLHVVARIGLTSICSRVLGQPASNNRYVLSVNIDVD